MPRLMPAFWSRPMSPCPGRQTGFSLIEMMVALVAGMIVSTALVAFMLSSMKSNGEYVQSTRLTQELRNTLDLLTRDLLRAGYDDNGLKYVGNTNLSPFSPICLTAAGAPTTCVTAGNSGDCIIYAYDRTHPNGGDAAGGTAGALNLGNGEVRGIRRRAITNLNGISVGVIEYAFSQGTVKPVCDGATATYSSYPPSCNGTSLWCPLSDPTSVDITGLTITNRSSQIGFNPSALISRKFDISIVGRPTGKADLSRNVQTSLKIRSDCLRATIANCTASP